jgi:hypothetical protein
LVDAIVVVSPTVSLNTCRHCDELLRRSNPFYVASRWIASLCSQ